MLKPKGEYRVHASIAENKDILLAIVPPNRNAQIHVLRNLLTGAQKTMKAIQAPPQLTPSTSS